MVRKLTGEQQRIVDAFVRRYVRANCQIGMQPELLDRVRIEAEEMVENGYITEADLEPARHDITECGFQRYDVYVSPKE
ncbi:MAG: hypothetical protein AB7U82_27720 [Blastocatellales bacterium]